jgi:two-component system phosphate regulon response regulator PhoB
MTANILVADDEPDIRRIIRILLKRAGYDVVEAENGSRALEVFHDRRPDAAIMDVMMPSLTGLEVVRAVRGSGTPLRQTPIILLSARAMPHEVASGVESGADRYMVKPFSPNDLIGAVADLLGDAHRRAAHSTSPRSEVRG